MADFSEIMKLTPRQLKKAKEVAVFLKLLGLSDEDIKLIPQIIRNWPIVVKNMNDMSADFANFKMQLADKDDKNKDKDDFETPASIRQGIGFGENAENVDYSKCRGGSK